MFWEVYELFSITNEHATRAPARIYHKVLKVSIQNIFIDIL